MADHHHSYEVAPDEDPAVALSSVPPREEPPAIAVALSLQRRVGNSAAARILQRQPPGATVGKSTRQDVSATVETIYSALRIGGLTSQKVETVLRELLTHRDQATEIRETYRNSHHYEIEDDLARMSEADAARARDYLNHGKLRTMTKVLIALQGAGTDLTTLYRVLADAHAEGGWAQAWSDVVEDPKNTLAGGILGTSFRGQSLEDALDSDLDGYELIKAIAIVNHGDLRPIDKIFIAMDQAGTDEALLFEGLGSVDAATVEQQFKDYPYRKHSALAIGSSLFHVLDDELSGEDYDRALTLIGYERDPTAGLFSSGADGTGVRKRKGGKLVALVKAAVGGLGTNTQLIWDSIKVAPDTEITELRALVEDPKDPLGLTGLTGDLSDSDMARLRAMLGIKEAAGAPGVASTRDASILQDPLVVRLRALGGVDKTTAFDTIRMTAGKDWAAFKAGYEDRGSNFRNYLTDNCTVKEEGDLPIVLGNDLRRRLNWCIGTLSDDEDYLFHLLKNFATNEDKRALRSDPAFMDKMKSNLSSSEYTQGIDLLRPSDETPQESAAALDAATKDARGGAFDAVTGTGAALQDENRDLQAGIKIASLDANLSPEEQKQLSAAGERTKRALKDYIAARDEFIGTAEMVVNIAVGVVVSALTAGAAGPIVAAQLARAALAMAMMRVLSAKALKGDQFDVFGSDGAVAFASGAADGVMNVLGGVAARGLVTAGLEGVGITAQQVARSSYGSLGVKAITQVTEGGIGGGVGGTVDSLVRDETWRQGFANGVETSLKAGASSAGQGAAISGGIAIGAHAVGAGAHGGPEGGAATDARAGKVRAPAEWQALRGALGDLGDRVPIVENPKLETSTVRVRYGDGAGIRLEIGPEATAVHIARHVSTARFLLKYEGILGQLLQLRDKIMSLLRQTPGYGTKGFEARAEVTKLTAIRDELVGRETAIRKRIDAAADAADAGAAQKELDALGREMTSVEDQLKKHQADVDSYKPGEGFIAAEGPADTPEVKAAKANLEKIQGALREDAATKRAFELIKQKLIAAQKANPQPDGRIQLAVLTPEEQRVLRYVMDNEHPEGTPLRDITKTDPLTDAQLKDLKDKEAAAYEALRKAEIPLYDKLRAGTRASTKEDVLGRARRPAKELRDLGALIDNPLSPYPDAAQIPIDQVTLLQPRSARGLAVDHIVAIKELLDDWPDFKKLTLDQQLVIVNDPVNLMAIDASANGSKSDWSWRSWPNRGSYYPTPEALARGGALDAAARAHLAKEIAKMLAGG